jgi:hypothetical protein
VDYSVPPGLVGRRVGVRISPAEVVVHLDGRQVARHHRSFAPTDVVLDPAHARALRDGDVQIDAVDLARYDRLLGVGS